MSVSVSDAVLQEVQQKVADHQASVNLLQNQINVANESLSQWQAIAAELVVPQPAQVELNLQG